MYLWVDGSDPAWRAKRQQALLATDKENMAKHGDVAGRYRDNQELRFNLRALEKFFPEHGHVFIVTDDQAPSWLKTSAQISLIDHRTLIPDDALPVFDSGHIESYLHHIPHLSEKFIYLNDDVFFGSPVQADDWFGKDGIAVFKELTCIPDYTTLQKNETALVNASILSRQWLSQQYPKYQHTHKIFAHAPRPMLKSVMRELESLAPELFAQARETVFRDWQRPPIIPDLVPRWMLHTGLANLQQIDYLYICSGDENAAEQFADLIKHFGQLAFFCINDTCDNADKEDPQLQRIKQSLESILPLPSKFEI